MLKHCKKDDITRLKSNNFVKLSSLLFLNNSTQCRYNFVLRMSPLFSILFKKLFHTKSKKEMVKKMFDV